MASSAQIVKALHDAPDPKGGAICPHCKGPTGVIFTRQRNGFVFRRRMCGRCRLKISTSERVVGGYTASDLEQAERNLAEWRRRNGIKVPATN